MVYPSKATGQDAATPLLHLNSNNSKDQQQK
jgi:hypothetical protein